MKPREIADAVMMSYLELTDQWEKHHVSPLPDMVKSLYVEVAVELTNFDRELVGR